MVYRFCLNKKISRGIDCFNMAQNKTLKRLYKKAGRDRNRLLKIKALQQKQNKILNQIKPPKENVYSDKIQSKKESN